MIRLEEVTKSFDDKVAVGGIYLEVPAGSILGLIGPNGAGKTTTLRMIATLMKPDSGRIEIQGLDSSREVKRCRRLLGFMPDQFGTFRLFTTVEYLQYFGRSYGYHGAELKQRLEAVLELTDLGGLRKEAVSALSMGLRQRLLLAKTLLHDPEVLVLDEPASGLDPRARIEIRSLLKELGRMGKTVLVSSHILADLEEICSRIAILEAGMVVWSGALADARKELRAQRFEVAIEVPEAERARALGILERLAGVEGALLRDGKIVVKIGDQNGNRLLKALIDAEIEVLSFAEEKAGLEAIFLERTRGIVS